MCVWSVYYSLEMSHVCLGVCVCVQIVMGGTRAAVPFGNVFSNNLHHFFAWNPQTICVGYIYMYIYIYDRLEEFKKLNPPVDLIAGSEIELTIRGDTLLYKNAVGGVGTIKSEAFTKALCDVYYGSNAVSPSHRDAVLAGVSTL
jgi:hypothetical protein